MSSPEPGLLLRLEEMRADATVAVTELEAEIAVMVAASEGSNADDEHDPEGATIAYERAQLLAVLAGRRQELAEVDAALARVDAGDYGRCQTCGAAIGAARLAARPAARQCLRCASRPPGSSPPRRGASSPGSRA